MNKDIEVIRALVELGDKATPYALFSIGHSVCYDGRYVGEDGEECGDAIRVAEADSGVAEFLCAAANACPAIRAMLARMEKLEKVAKAAEKLADGMGISVTHDGSGVLCEATVLMRDDLRAALVHYRCRDGRADRIRNGGPTMNAFE